MSKNSLPILRLGLLGLLIIGVAWIARTTILSRRKLHPPVDPVMVAKEKEFGELRKAVAANPKDAAAHWKLADFFDRNKVYSKSIVEYGTLIRLNPKDIQARLKFADSCMFLNQFPIADANYNYVTHKDPKNLHAWQGLTAALIKERRFYEATLAGDTAVRIKKDDPDSRFLRAIAVLENIIQFPNPTARSEKLKLVRTDLFVLTKFMPNNGDLYYQLGRASQVLLQHKEAAGFLEKAHQLSPDNSEAARMLAIVYQELHQDDKALKLMQAQNAAYPNDPATNDILGQLLQASTMPDALPQAIAAFRNAVKLAPQDPYLLENLAAALEKHGDYKEACADFERVTQINPFLSFAFERLAAIYTRLGDTKHAAIAAKLGAEMAANEQQLKQIQALCQRHPEDPNLHLILADRFRTMKLYGPARDEYYAVLSLDPKNKHVPKKFMQDADSLAAKGLY